MSTDQQTEQIRKRLQDERTALQGQLDALSIQNEDNQVDDYGSGHHPGDDATELFLRQRNIPLRSNAEDTIAAIDGALARLDAGTYGICTRCGRQIDPERLEALSHAELCITCKAEVERERANQV